MVITKVKKVTKPRVTKPTSSNVKKVYKDFFDVQRNAPRKLGEIAVTPNAQYVLVKLVPPVWKKQ